MYSIDQQSRTNSCVDNKEITMTSTNLVTGIKSPKICNNQENVEYKKNNAKAKNQTRQIIKDEGICFGKPVIGGLITTVF